MMKFIRTPNVMINPDHVAAVEQEPGGKLVIRFAIPTADGHYVLRIDEPQHEIWMMFGNRQERKAGV
jgi:hypothetical protein